MITCPHCHVQIGGDSEYCPLCQNRLPGTPDAPYWPATAPRIHRAGMLYKIVAFLALGSCMAGGAVDFLLIDTPHTHWSLLAVLWVIVGLLVLRGILRRRYNGPRQLFNLLLIVSAMLVFTDWFHGYTGFSLDLAVPILCSISLVCNFIFSIVRSRYTVNALVYMLMNIGIGILPYLLLFFRVGGGTMNARNIPWVICLIISMITFLGLVIFRGRDLRCELEKRLHL